MIRFRSVAVVSSLAVLAVSSVTATAQDPPESYAWSVIRPLAGGFFPYRQVPIDVTVRWIKGTKVNEIAITATDRHKSDVLDRRAIKLQYNPTASSVKLQGTIGTSKLPGLEGDDVTLTFTAKDGAGQQLGSVKTVTIKVIRGVRP